MSAPQGAGEPGAPAASQVIELPAGLPRALLRAARALLRADAIPLLVLCALLAGTAALGLVVIAHGVAVLLLAVLAGTVHELGHVAAYRALAPARVALLQGGGMRATLHREALSPRSDRLVTLAGPAAPLALAALALPVAGALPAEAVATGVIAAGHLLGLVLPTADRRAWRAAGDRPSTAAREAPTLGP